MTEGRRVGRSSKVEGSRVGLGAEPHVNTSACPTGLHGQQATQTNRATDRQTEGQTDRRGETDKQTRRGPSRFPDKQMTWKSQTKANAQKKCEREKY